MKEIISGSRYARTMSWSVVGNVDNPEATRGITMFAWTAQKWRYAEDSSPQPLIEWLMEVEIIF